MTETAATWLLALQQPWPLVERPLDALARRLGTDEKTLAAFAEDLLAQGLVRRVGGVFDARRLGYRSCLFAIDAKTPERLKAAAKAVCALPGVTHAYVRGWPKDFEAKGICAADYANFPNLWYTLSALAESFDAEAAQLQSFAPIAFPATMRYKIDVVFDLRTRRRDERTEYAAPQALRPTTPFTPAQQALVRRYQETPANLAVPFRAEDLPQLRAWQADGTLRRFALLLRHRATGFTANGMCCWPVATDDLDRLGRRLAAESDVTHCYARPPNARFPFTLYAMIHKTSWLEGFETFRRLTRVAGLPGAGKVFFSTRELKKSSIPFFCEEN